MKVAVINTTFLNGGDAAINFGTMQILRRVWGEKTRFVFFDAQPETARNHYPALDVRPSLFDGLARCFPAAPARKLALIGILAAACCLRYWPGIGKLPVGRALFARLQDYAGADVVVSAGGTYLVDNYRLAPRLVEFLVVLALGRPLVFFTQSIGPLTGRRDRFMLRWIMRRATLVMVRDNRSRQEVISLGVPPRRLITCPDAAFALGVPRPAVPLPRSGNPVRIAVSVRDWPFFEADDRPAWTSEEVSGKAAEGENAWGKASGRISRRGPGMDGYLDAVAGFIRRAVASAGAQVTMLSTCQGIDDYWTDDAAVAERVVARLPAHIRDGIEIDRSFHTPERMIARLTDFDCVVATRMHMAILALCAGCPVVPIAYEFKTRELFGMLDFDTPVLGIDTVTADDLYDAWRATTDGSRAGGMSRGWADVDAARQGALESGAFVTAALPEPGRP